MQLLILLVWKPYQVKNGFIKCLDDTALYKVQVIRNIKIFKFGDGQKIYSKYKAIISAKIGKTECCIQTKI